MGRYREALIMGTEPSDALDREVWDTDLPDGADQWDEDTEETEANLTLHRRGEPKINKRSTWGRLRALRRRGRRTR